MTTRFRSVPPVAAPRRPRTRGPLPGLLLAGLLLSLGPCGTAAAADDFSAAERALFMRNHFERLAAPVALDYRFRRSGSLETAFDDSARLNLSANPDGSCCVAAAEFLQGDRRVALPQVEQAQGNPVILHFLERDIREMNRLTKGQANYFRKRIRMAIYQGATVVPVASMYRGRSVDALRITIRPYLDDPLRARYERLAGKTYVFTLSDAVPGGVIAIHTQIDGATAADAPLIVEDLWLDGAQPTPPLPARNP